MADEKSWLVRNFPIGTSELIEIERNRVGADDAAAGPGSRKRLKLDPDLADGHHWTIHDKPDSMLLELLRAWMSEASDGEAITIELVEMSDSEVERLDDV